MLHLQEIDQGCCSLFYNTWAISYNRRWRSLGCQLCWGSGCLVCNLRPIFLLDIPRANPSQQLDISFQKEFVQVDLLGLLTGTELLSLLSDFHPLVFSAAEWKNSAKDANGERDVFWGVWHVPLTMKNLAHLTLEGIQRREPRWIGSRFLDEPNIHVREQHSPFPATLPSSPTSVFFFPFCSLRIPYNVFSSSSFLLGPPHPTLCPLSF